MPYTLNQEQKIRQSAPVNKEIAEKLASEFGVTVRSVISKTISMKVPYIKSKRYRLKLEFAKQKLCDKLSRL